MHTNISIINKCKRSLSYRTTLATKLNNVFASVFFKDIVVFKINNFNKQIIHER